MPSLSILCLRSSLVLAAVSLLPRAAAAQISLTTAIDLALRSSSRVQVASADLDRARAAFQESRDVYIPSATVGGSGYGKSYGYPLGQPTALNIQAQSLVFSFSQRDYIRSARAGLDSADLNLRETQQAVAEDVLLTYAALDRDAARLGALHDQEADAQRLVTIIQSRLDAGEDTGVDLTGSRLTLAQIRLRLLQAEDDTAVDRARLAHLTGLPVQDLSVAQEPFPAIPTPGPAESSLEAAPTPGIKALYATARARQEQAFGDARYLFRPQVSFAAQYSLISTFANSDFFEYFGRRDRNGVLLPYPSYAVGAGVQVSVPVLDYVHRARARESAAEAVRARHDADGQRDQFTEARLRNQRTTRELAARAEIATLDRQLAQQQLDILELQLQSAGSSPTPMTPKDEQNARITERDKFLTFVDAQFELRQASITLLRQTGELEPWLRSLNSPLPSHPSPTGTSLQLTPGAPTASLPQAP